MTTEDTDANKALAEHAGRTQDLTSLRQFFKGSAPELDFLTEITNSEIVRLQQYCGIDAEHRYCTWAWQVYFGRSLGDRALQLSEAIKRHEISHRVAFLLVLYGRNNFGVQKTIQIMRRDARSQVNDLKTEMQDARKAAKVLLAFTVRLKGVFEPFEEELRIFLEAMEHTEDIPEEVLKEQFGSGEVTRSGAPRKTRDAVAALVGLLESAHIKGAERWAQDAVDLFEIVGVKLAANSVREWSRKAKK